jgi:hypothetical protein
LNVIKFSHRYSKLSNVYSGDHVKLLEVYTVNLEMLHQSFRDYDTDGVYPLPSEGIFLLLIFQKPDDEIFTTLRRYDFRKWTYYSSNCGKMFSIEIGE